ncbi:hypothetical protein NCCP2331_25250 [Sporosarcina sp. NCCP-2331]|nr:hypothetical protein NCCP2331_25250 [Sporosarcina sp. NCCP-2331]GLB56489.1 hypothetical protein NCCP2378_22760 [Sporosarcina sp. NCCP-2378]
MIIIPAQALITRPQPLIYTGRVIIRLGRMIIPDPAVIIEPYPALIVAPQLHLC